MRFIMKTALIVRSLTSIGTRMIRCIITIRTVFMINLLALLVYAAAR